MDTRPAVTPRAHSAVRQLPSRVARPLADSVTFESFILPPLSYTVDEVAQTFKKSKSKAKAAKAKPKSNRRR